MTACRVHVRVRGWAVKLCVGLCQGPGCLGSRTANVHERNSGEFSSSRLRCRAPPACRSPAARPPGATSGAIRSRSSGGTHPVSRPCGPTHCPTTASSKPSSNGSSRPPRETLDPAGARAEVQSHGKPSVGGLSLLRAAALRDHREGSSTAMSRSWLAAPAIQLRYHSRGARWRSTSGRERTAPEQVPGRET